MFQGRFKEVSNNFQASLRDFKKVSRNFQEWLMSVLSVRKFQRCFKSDPRVIQGCFKGLSRKFQECFKCDSNMFQGGFRKICKLFQRSQKGCFKVILF